MGERLKKWVLLAFFLGVSIGCSSKPVLPDPIFTLDSPQALAAIALTEKEAVRQGYRPQKMRRVIKADPDAGNFVVYLFPVDPKTKAVDNAKALYSIVKARTGQLICFSDPSMDRSKERKF